MTPDTDVLDVFFLVYTIEDVIEKYRLAMDLVRQHPGGTTRVHLWQAHPKWEVGYPVELRGRTSLPPGVIVL